MSKESIQLPQTMLAYKYIVKFLQPSHCVMCQKRIKLPFEHECAYETSWWNLDVTDKEWRELMFRLCVRKNVAAYHMGKLPLELWILDEGHRATGRLKRKCINGASYYKCEQYSDLLYNIVRRKCLLKVHNY